MSAEKISRELRRLLFQTGGLPKLSFYDPVRRVHYEWVERRRILRRDGVVGLQGKVAIYLIFPKTGLLDSHIAAIEAIANAGYAPLVVSNLPLGEQDRDRVTARAWRYLERPNFGYDFGGYRDAILELEGILFSLQRLVILNDSVWFPLPAARDWISEAETSGLDFVAACSHATIYQMKNRRKTGEGASRLPEYQSMVWDYRHQGNRRFHYVSFAQSIAPKALQHKGFIKFWRQLRLSNSKHRTVRRGEVGLTRWVIRAGLKHGATLDAADLPQQLEKLDDQSLRHVAETTISFGHTHTAGVVAEALKDETLERDALIQLILFVVARQGISYAIPAFTVASGFAFLKKSPVWEDQRASDITLDVIRSLEGPFAETIMKEALALRPFPGTGA